MFDLEAPKLQLEKFGFFTEQIDAAGRLAAGAVAPVAGGHASSGRAPRAAPHAPAPPRGLIAALVARDRRDARARRRRGVAAAVPGREDGAGHVHDRSRKGATIEIEGKQRGHRDRRHARRRELEVGRAYPVVARLDGYEPKQSVVQPQRGRRTTSRSSCVASHARRSSSTRSRRARPIEIDGKPRGTTPLTITTLAAGHVGARSRSRRPATRTRPRSSTCPARARRSRLIQPLAVSDELARVKLCPSRRARRSIQNGQLLAGVHDAGRGARRGRQGAALHADAAEPRARVIEPFTPARGAIGVVKTGKLVDGHAAQGRRRPTTASSSSSSAPHCKELALPAECVLAPGTYTVELIGRRPQARARGHGRAQADHREVRARLRRGRRRQAPAAGRQAGQQGAVRGRHAHGHRRRRRRHKRVQVKVKAGATVTPSSDQGAARDGL